ncbi:acyltransferase [Draconibacterium sp.]|nr:acyltransferase [Draconibacterium sp.]
MPKSRLFYIDNLRIFLISLVVLHHLSITYGAPGGWFYNESQAEFPTIIPMAMFVASNQAFFMGMFFFISAFFILPSLNRKGTKTFVLDRLMRLGIPLLFFYFLLHPLTIYIRNKFILDRIDTFFELLKNPDAWGFGPMWFVEALILFTAIFLLIRIVKWKIKLKFPGIVQIVLSAFLVGLLQFLIRLKMPVGTSQEFTGFQWPFFLQYIFLFAFGIIAYQNNWMESIDSRSGKRWFIFAQLLIFVGFPALFVGGGAAESGTDKFMGGLTWQCFSYSIWEQLVGFSLILGLIGIFKKRFYKQGSFAKKLSDSAYGVFIFHTPIIIGVSAVFINLQIPQLLKFVVLAPISLIVCFLVAWLSKQIPGVKRIL